MDLFNLISYTFLLVLVTNYNKFVLSSESHYRPDQVDTIQTNDVFNDEGKWYGPMYCPKNEYAVGFELQWQAFRGSHASWCAQKFDNGKCRDSSIGSVPTRDDNGVTGMILRCGKFNRTGVYFSGSKYGRYPSEAEIDYALLTGLSERTTNCKSSLVTGLIVRMQKRQGTGDDAGITNVKLKCKDGEIIGGNVDYDENVKGVDEFVFNERDSCASGQAVCGMKLKTVYDHHDDNAGLTDIILYCCTVIEPLDDSPSCEAEVNWVNVNEVINNGVTTQESTYTVTVGVTKQSGTRKVNSQSNTSGKDTGYGIELETGPEWAKVKASFEQKFSESSTKGTEKEISDLQIFQNEQTYSQKIVVAPKKKITILQKIGTCGDVQVRTGSFKFEESCLDGFERCDQHLSNDKESEVAELNLIEKVSGKELTSGAEENVCSYVLLSFVVLLCFRNSLKL